MTYLQAEDEILGVCNTAWIAAAAALAIGYAPALYFPDEVVDAPPIDLIYAQCGFSVVTSNQVSLSRYQGQSLYEEVGLFNLQVYAPKQIPGSLRTAKQFAEFVRSNFRLPSPSGDVWFRAQKLTHVAGNATKNQVNVTATCTYRTYK